MARNEDNSLTGRMRRYARVGGTMGGLAARLAGARYLGRELDRGGHASDLRLALGNLRGPLVKVAQILATIPDALPAEYAEELKQLQANAPAMGWPFVRRRMRTELGPDWESRFGRFEREASHAASLGQVHRAEDAQGSPLACKLQYPDMQAAVEADLKQLDWVLRLYARRDSTIATGRIYQELAARLREELDYDLEGRHMSLYGDMLADTPAVHVPRWRRDLSSGRLLTMSWEAGAPLLDFKAADLETRNAIALNLFRAWYVPFYRYGVIHGDPHLGNYSVRPDLAVNLLDFGCVRVFPPSFVRGVIDLYFALRDDDHDLAVWAYETWGFNNLSRELIQALNIWAEFVYAPLMQPGVRRIQEHESGMYGAGVVARVHEELRRLGGVEPPREFVFMDRAAIGLGSVFLHLKAELDWNALFHELIADFDEATLVERQAAMLQRHAVPQAV